MSKFYFDVSERKGSLTLDTIGADLPSEQIAMIAASKALLDIALDHILKAHEFQIGVVVRNEDGDEIGRRFARFSGAES